MHTTTPHTPHTLSIRRQPKPHHQPQQQAERLADMTDLERELEKTKAQLVELLEGQEAAEAQRVELAGQITSLTADLAAAREEVVMYQADLQDAEVGRGLGMCVLACGMLGFCWLSVGACFMCDSFRAQPVLGAAVGPDTTLDG